MTTPHRPSPGWYPDGNTPGAVRWWDGSAWTTHSVAAPPALWPAAPAPEPAAPGWSTGGQGLPYDSSASAAPGTGPLVDPGSPAQRLNWSENRVPISIGGGVAAVALLLVGASAVGGSSSTAGGVEMSVIDMVGDDCDPLLDSLDEETTIVCAMGSIIGGYAVVFRNHGDAPVEVPGDEIWMVGENGKTYAGQSAYGGTCTINPGETCDFVMVFPGGEPAETIGVTTSAGEMSVSSGDFGGSEEYLGLLRESAAG